MMSSTNPAHVYRFIALPKRGMIRHNFAVTPLLSVEQFWRSWRIGLGQSRVCQLAAFFAYLPSMEAEIDDKLPSNSS
jgi:hypothetical protein